MPGRDATVVKRFNAILEKGSYALGWTTVRIPFVPREVWPHLIRLRVRGTVNGFAFRNSLFPVPGTGYVLLVTRRMQQEAGIALGEFAEFELEPDMDPRPADLPDELATLLDEEPGLRAWFDELSESIRREIGKWIGLVKSDEARLQRCEQMAERLLSAMEGEHELPPVIAAAFRLRPKAGLGWQTMTPAQRRSELLAVFYYRTPESRDKRVRKLCDNAEKRLP